jgi:DnaJ-class molecular chaperone
VRECLACEGTGVIWDESACGDPDHCSPTYECPECGGSGEVEE